MRGQFEIVIPFVQIPTTETDIAGLIVPANESINVNYLSLAGPGVTANNEVRLRIKRFTAPTPTLNFAVTPKAKNNSNAIASDVTAGSRNTSAPYDGNVWSAAPSTLEAPIFDRSRNLFGGVIEYRDTMLDSLVLGGFTSAAYYTITGVAGTQFNGALVITFTR